MKYTQIAKVRTVADSADVDYFEIPAIPVVRRRCLGAACSTVLRQSNRGSLCSVCDRKYELARQRDEFRGFETEQKRSRCV